VLSHACNVAQVKLPPGSLFVDTRSEESRLKAITWIIFVVLSHACNVAQVKLPAGSVVKARAKLMAARVDSDDEGFSDGEGQETEWDGVRLLVRDDEDSEASDIEDFAEGVPCGPMSATAMGGFWGGVVLMHSIGALIHPIEVRL
jgi:hypothetical protein